jgi:hypothetical protein
VGNEAVVVDPTAAHTVVDGGTGAEQASTPALPVFTSIAPDPSWTLPPTESARSTTAGLSAPPAGDVAVLPTEEVCGACANPRTSAARFCHHCGTPYEETTSGPDLLAMPAPMASASATGSDPFAMVPDAPPESAPGKVTPTMVLRLKPAEQRRVLEILLAGSPLSLEQLHAATAATSGRDR